jgi:hypothetical protein
VLSRRWIGIVQFRRDCRCEEADGDYSPYFGDLLNGSPGLLRQVLATLTRSPRTVALAPGPAPSIPSGWHTLTFHGLTFSVPRAWPVSRTSEGASIGNMCLTPGVALTLRVTLSTDKRRVTYPCPLLFPRPQPPSDGLQVDSGSSLQLPPDLAFSSQCLHLNGLAACPATSLPYSILILILKVTVPGRTTPLIVSIGLARNGMTARTILYSLRAA